MQLNRRIVLVLAASGLTYWLTFGGTFGGALSWLHQTIGQILVFLMIAGASWSLLRQDSPTEYRTLPLGLSVLLGLILMELAVRALLQRSWNSTEDFALYVSGVIVFIVLINWFRDDSDLLVICVSSAVICALVGMALAYWRDDGELALPLGNRVLMAGLLILTSPLAISGFRTHPGGLAQRALWLSGAAILAVGVIETRSALQLGVDTLGTGFWSMPVKHAWDRTKQEMELITVAANAKVKAKFHFPRAQDRWA